MSISNKAWAAAKYHAQKNAPKPPFSPEAGFMIGGIASQFVVGAFWLLLEVVARDKAWIGASGLSAVATWFYCYIMQKAHDKEFEAAKSPIRN